MLLPIRRRNRHYAYSGRKEQVQYLPSGLEGWDRDSLEMVKEEEYLLVLAQDLGRVLEMEAKAEV